jgi:hypothetical protein
MEAKIIFISSFMLLLIACTDKAEENNNVALEGIQKYWQLGTKDTTLVEKVGNSFVKYHLQGDSIYRLEWGNEKVNNTSKDTFKVLGCGILSLIDNDENTIILGQNCGISCIYYVILPLTLKSKERTYLFAKAYNLEKKLVAYIPDEDDIFVRVENFITGQYMNIKEENVCMAGFKGDYIDSIYFSDENIIIKWQGKEWSNDKSDTKEKKIKIKLD